MTPADDRLGGLRKGAVGGWGAFVLAFGSLAPAITMGLAPLSVWLVSGPSTWLVFVVSAVCMLGVAACVSVFARRIVGTGSVYTYIADVFGARGRLVAAACLIGGWGSLLLISVPMLVMYGTPFLASVFGTAARGEPFQVVVTGLVLLSGCLLAVRGLSASARAMWVLVGLSTAASAVLLLAAALRAGAPVLTSFGVGGVNLPDVARGLPLSFTLLLGFEGSAAFAYETRMPRVWVPRILYGLPLGFGALLLFGTATELPVLTGAQSDVESGASLLEVLGQAARMPWLSAVVSGVLFLALLAGNIGIISMAARIFATLAQDGMLPRVLRRVHPGYRTPVAAIVFLSVVRWGAPWVIIFVTGWTPLGVYVWAGTLLSFWWVPLYGLVCVGALLYVRAAGGRVRPFLVLAAAAGLGISAFSFASALLWPGEGALRLLPYLFLALFVALLAGVAAFHRWSRPADGSCAP